MQTRKKTYLLPQDLIEKAKRALGAKTETEAIVMAMREVALRRDLVKWHLKNKGRLKIQNLYGR